VIRKPPRAARHPGKVSLVGAGPGDPDLLTLRACRALAEADLVLYDALVDARMLEHAPRAAKFSVGKRAGAASVAQETIHALMIRAARQGKRVVRLKAGDPFVLGRGGEEAIALGEAGIEVDVVPGLSSSIVAAQAVGIPVTHRGVASAFVVASAVPEARFVALASSLPDRAATLVVLMGLGSRELVEATLLGAGWSPDTPAAIVLGAHGPRQWSATSTLATLAAVSIPADRSDLPGVLVIGEVVDVGAAIRAATHGHGAQDSATYDEGAVSRLRQEERRVSG
jgi:uroporphyrin-III C-methyltransferase